MKEVKYAQFQRILSANFLTIVVQIWFASSSSNLTQAQAQTQTQTQIQIKFEILYL